MVAKELFWQTVFSSTSGPGRLCQALAVTRTLDGMRLDRKPFRVVARGGDPVVVHAGVRIGITKARELPWRFVLADSRFLSQPFAATPARRAARDVTVEGEPTRAATAASARARRR